MNLRKGWANILLQRCYKLTDSCDYSLMSCPRPLQRDCDRATADQISARLQSDALDFLAYRFTLRKQIQIIRAAGF